MSFWRRLFARTAEGAPSSEVPAPRELRVLVDHRERAGGFVQALEETLPPDSLEVAVLEVGDVLVAGTVALERKRTDDFCASLKDGRLFEQASRLRRAHRAAALLVEGEFSREAVGEMNGAALRGALVSLSLEWQLPILRTRDTADSARYVAAILERLRARGLGATGAFTPATAPPAGPVMSPVEAALHAIPGIGPVKVRALAGRFATLPELLAAQESDLAAVPGIGRDTAGRIVAALKGKA